MKNTLITGKNLIIRKAVTDDIQFMGKAETDAENSPWIGHWNDELRLEQFKNPDVLQTIIELKGGQKVGFIIFRELLNKDLHIELKRICITEKGKGYGKEALYLSQDLAFNKLNAQKLYLHTKTENIRAQNIYKATGFNMEMPDPCTSFYLNKIDYKG